MRDVMATIKLDIVSAERLVFSEDVTEVVAPGVAGQLGILPHHAPLMTMLQPGELLVRKDGEEVVLAISGGFLEVRPDRVIVLADAAYGATPEKVKARPGWDVIAAVVNDAFHPIDPDIISRPGPRVIQGLEALARLIHPELWE